MDTKVVRVIGCRDVRYTVGGKPESCTWDTKHPEAWGVYVHKHAEMGDLASVHDTAEDALNAGIQKACELKYGLVVEAANVALLNVKSIFNKYSDG